MLKTALNMNLRRNNVKQSTEQRKQRASEEKWSDAELREQSRGQVC